MQQQRTERVELETTRHHITGDVTLAADGFRSRISDLLNATEREFLSLTDVEITPLAGGDPVRRPFVAVSRQHIVFVSPLSTASD
jgi:flavin-dependent dehydrogenase